MLIWDVSAIEQRESSIIQMRILSKWEWILWGESSIQQTKSNFHVVICLKAKPAKAKNLKFSRQRLLKSSILRVGWRILLIIMSLPLRRKIFITCLKKENSIEFISRGLTEIKFWENFKFLHWIVKTFRHLREKRES